MLRSQAGSQVISTVAPGSGAEGRATSQDRLSPQTPASEAVLPETVGDDWCCGGESLWLMRERWQKLQNDFFSAKKDRYDLSKIPGACMRYVRVWIVLSLHSRRACRHL